jgi:hypothetical protein
MPALGIRKETMRASRYFLPKHAVRIPAGSLAAIGALLLGLGLPSQAEASYFAGVDATLASAASASSARGLTVHRYYRLMARLSVFALYCDPGNRKGYATRFSRVWQASGRMQAEATRILGGQVAAYNIFEDMRNEESLRLARASLAELCAQDDATFKQWVSATAAQIENQCRVTPRGDM